MSSNNGYATLSELESLVGVRQYRDVIVQHPSDDRTIKFRIQSLTESEWSDVSSGNFDMKRGGLSQQGIQDSDSRLVAVSLVDGDGNVLIRGADAVDKIKNLGASIVEPLVRACREFNNLRSSEGGEKNSPGGSESDTSSAAEVQPAVS